MIRSRLEQTNSLVNSGDFITIKTPYPINPDNTIILGYYLITNDVIDYQNTIFGQFCIVKESEDKVISENDIIWEYLHKTREGDCEFLKQACSKQTEPYYIYFKFTKLRDNGQIINIDKVSLKIADNKKNKKKFFYYDKSIFKEIDLYNSQNLNWAYSVLDKIKSKGDSIPSFVDRGKDFTTFWGWICHFFSVIVNYGRQFLNIFEDRNLFLEFLRQKDIYRDIRVDLYEDLISNVGNELLYNPILGYKIINHYAIKKDGFIYSGLLNIKENNLIKLKISNSDKLDFNFDIDVDIAFYDNKKAFVQGYTVELNKSNLTTELIIERDKNINYIAISYKPIYNKDEIYLVNIYSFGKGSYGIKMLEKKDLLNIYNSFRKRGTKFSNNSIKSLCKTELNDSFFSNYLNSSNIGWFLNKSCPLISHLSNFEKINQIVIDKLTPLNTGEFVEFQDNIIAFSDINVINIKWNKKEWNNSDSVAKNSYIKKVTIFCSLYDINKKAYYPPQNQVILNGDNLNGIVIDNIPNYKTEVNIPIQLIENISQKNIINSFVNLDYKDICVFTHLTKDNSIIEFIKIKAIYFELNNQESFIETTNEDEQYINKAFLGIYFKNISEGTVRIKPTRLGIGGQQNQLEFEFPSQESKHNLVCNYDISEMDLENGYKKVPIFENSSLLGVILIRLNNLYKENNLFYNIQPSVTKRNYLFYENLNGKYDYIPENVLIDFGDAFSYYLKPGDILEHGNSYTTLFDEEINSSGEVVKSKFDSLECNLSFYKLPYNLGFINIKDYYLTYYKNHGQYSNKELENIINLKFLPYYGYKLFLNSSNISSSIYKPMKFLLFEIKNPLDWNSNLGKINIIWKGGCPNYTIIIKGKVLQDNGEYEEFNYKQENIDKTKYSKDLNNGIYSLIIKDNLGKELNKGTFYIIKPNDISYNIKYYILGGNKDIITSKESSGIYDEVYISLNGGTPPYRISYTNTSNQTSTLFVENGRYILLNKIKAPRNTEFTISIVDSNNASKELTLKNDKYFEMYDNGEGTCQLKN